MCTSVTHDTVQSKFQIIDLSSMSSQKVAQQLIAIVQIGVRLQFNSRKWKQWYLFCYVTSKEFCIY
jgi:hypothetical protein